MPTTKRPVADTARFPKSTPAADAGKAPAALIDARIAELADWRGAMLSRLRTVIRDADASVIEEWKWNVPVWSCDGIVCTGETYRNSVKLTFPKGAALADPAGLFNSSLEGNVRRAIDFPEDAVIDAAALAALLREAIAANRAAPAGKRKAPARDRGDGDVRT